MSNIKEAFKRFLSVALSVTTTVWLSGLTLLLPVTPVLAVTPEQYGLKEGDLIRAPSLPAPDGWKVYIVNQHGYKRHIFNPDVFNMYGHFSWGSIKDVSPDVVNAFTTSDLYRVHGTEPVYSVDANGIKRWLRMTAEQFVQKGYDWNQVFVVNATEGAYYTVGSDITADDTTTPPPTGSINITLASNTPAAAVVPISATGVNFLKFVVSNGTSGEVSITNLTAKREGAGASADFSNVYLFQGGNRLTSGRSVNSSTHNAVFSGLDIKIPAGGSVTLDIVADLASTATAGNVHVFSVSDVTVSGTAATGKATGNVMTVASVSGGTITIAKNGTLTNPKVAEKGVEVAQFQLTVGSTEDIRLTRLILTNAGNISRSELTNFKLRDRATNTELASASGLNSKDQAVFELATPILLEKGNAKTYSVYADIGGSAKGDDTIRMYLENSADLLAVGQIYGFGVGVTSTSYDNSANDGSDASWTTVQAGQLTIVFNGPAAKDIAKNGKDIDIFSFSMTSQVEVEVRQIALIFDSSSSTNLNDGTTSNFTDVKIWDTDSNTVVWGPQDISGTGSATSQTLTFTEDILMQPNKTRNFKVTLDVANTSDLVDGNKIRATIDVSAFSNQVKNLQNNTFLATTDIVPGSDVVGNDMTVRVAALTITLATSPTSQTYVKGTNNVPMVGFNFAAGVGQTIKVTSIKVTCYIDASNASGETDFQKGQDADASGTVSCQDDVTQMRLKVDGTQIGDNKSPAATTDGTATFNNLTLTIPDGTTKVVLVEGDISASAFRNSNVERVAIDIADVSADITASDPDGNSVTATGDAVNGGTSPNRIVTIQNTGSLTVAAAPTETDVTDSRIVEAGLSKVTLSKFRFTAQNEALMITKARVKIVSADADADVTSAVTALYLYDQDGTLVAGPTSLTPVTAAGTTDAQADFNNISGFTIPKDDSRTITVKADLNTSSGLSNQMGQQFSVDLEADDNAEARGIGQSGTVLSDLGDDVAGNDVILRKGQPKVELVALPTTQLTNGTTVMMKFKVTALSNDIALKHFTFQTANSDGVNVSISAMAVRKSSDKVNLSASSSVAGTTTLTTNITFTSEQTISKGSSIEYEFVADVTGAAAADTLATKILGDTAVVTGELSTFLAAQQIDDLDDVLNVGNNTDDDGAYNFIWSDQSSIPHNDTVGTTADTDDADASNDWTNGHLVRTLPTDTQSLTFPS